jgi:hypothetical protein
MNTALKMILAAASVTACLATPAAAANHARFNSSTATSVSGGQLGTDRVPVIDDCIHVAFPQCSGGM